MAEIAVFQDTAQTLGTTESLINSKGTPVKGHFVKGYIAEIFLKQQTLSINQFFCNRKITPVRQCQTLIPIIAAKQFRVIGK